MARTEEEVKNYVKNLVSDFRGHKKTIVKAYGKEKVETILKQRVEQFQRGLDELHKHNPDIKVEEVVNHFNDVVDQRCISEGGDILDNLYNKQLNIIAGMIIRGHDI